MDGEAHCIADAHKNLCAFAFSHGEFPVYSARVAWNDLIAVGLTSPSFTLQLTFILPRSESDQLEHAHAVAKHNHLSNSTI